MMRVDDDRGVPPWRHLDALVQEFAESATSLEHEMLQRIAATVPGYDGPPADADLHAASCSAHVDFIRDPAGAGATNGPYRIGADGASRGVPLAAVLATYRIGAQVIWEQVAAYALTKGAAVPDIVRLASEVWLMHDRFATAMEEGWRDEDQVRVARAHRERASLVEQILSGGDVSTARLWDAVDRLGLPRSASYVVVVVQVERAAVDPLPSIESQLAAGGSASAWSLRADRLVGVGVVVAEGDEHELIEVLRRAEVTGGISPVGDDWSEAPRALRLATAASAASPIGRVTRFGELPVATSAAAAPDISRRLAEAVLHGVLDLPARDRASMLTTVRAWFDADGSTDRTAAALDLHPNSVRNRLRRFESLTGRSLTVPGQVAEIAVALSGLEPRGVAEDVTGVAVG